MFQTKVVEKLDIHILYSVTFFNNRAVCEIMWKKYGISVQATDDNNSACALHARYQGHKQTNKHTHTGCLTLIDFALEQWLHERATTIHYT
jgi:hypothetical protein